MSQAIESSVDGKWAENQNPSEKKNLKTRLLAASVWLFIVASIVIILIVWISNARTKNIAEPFLYDTTEKIVTVAESDRVAVVLGCSPKIGKRVNLFYKYRIAAAVELWEAGKVRGFIVSGDNRTKHYSEPDDMKASLIEAGVPKDKIVCDYAGLRTLDSVLRAKHIFGQSQLIIVSQKFHNERAICIAKEHGIDAIAYNAKDVSGSNGQKTHQREKLARVKMWLDLKVSKTQPRHFSEKHEITAF